MPEDDFIMELMRSVDGVPDRVDWLVLGPEVFRDVRKHFEHPLLKEVKLLYKSDEMGDVELRFRKKA